MADGDPTKWRYFEDMNVIEFLQMCLYNYDKQQDLKIQRKLQRGISR